MKKISTRFALLMAAAAIVPLLAYGAVSILSLRSGAQQTVVQGNLDVARRVAEQIELYVSGSIKILNAVSADLQQTGLERWQQDRILKNFVLQFPEFTELTILDETGHPVISSALGISEASVPGSDSVNIDGALMSKFVLDDALLPTAVVAVRMDDGDRREWLVGKLNLEELWRMVDRIHVGTQGYALVVTSEGQLLAHGDPDQKSKVARGDNLQSHPLITALRGASRSDTTVSAEYSDGQRSLLGVAARLPSLGWTVIVEQPQSEAFAIPIALQRQLVIAITLALLAMLVVGYFWGRSFINPILALTKGTQALAAGHLEQRVAVETRDELGQLGDAFNNMADRLVELQDNVRKTERQAVFGRVAVGLVHDLSHPIQNIGNSCKLIVKMFDDIEYRESFKRTVEREFEQVKRVLEDLRNLAKPKPLEKFPLDVNKALHGLAESMLAGAESSGISLETEFVFGPLWIEGDLYALNRIHRNLLTNAFQATPPRGRVIIRTMRRNDQAVIEIVDTGSGIPAERLNTIFDDYYTTKKQGLGLGLALSKKLVEQLGGTISVTSEVGVGTTFILRFPITKARPSQLAAV
ncbi:MAG TPA: sensor histidine kinase [Vicinamibacterales bacterium]|nr:sensor histidine kinase [Vicinamibacterales bacterium]